MQPEWWASNFYGDGKMNNNNQRAGDLYDPPTQTVKFVRNSTRLVIHVCRATPFGNVTLKPISVINFSPLHFFSYSSIIKNITFMGLAIIIVEHNKHRKFLP